MEEMEKETHCTCVIPLEYTPERRRAEGVDRRCFTPSFEGTTSHIEVHLDPRFKSQAAKEAYK
jgi:hypothetical protein